MAVDSLLGSMQRASIFLNVIVPKKAAFWVMSAGLSEGHQGAVYHPVLRHAQDVSQVLQSWSI